MSKFKPFFTNNASAIPYTDGAMIFDTKTKKLRFDVNDQSYEIESGKATTTTTTTTVPSTSGRTGGSVKGLPDMGDAKNNKNFLAVNIPKSVIEVTNSCWANDAVSAEFSSNIYFSKDIPELTKEYFMDNEPPIEPSYEYSGFPVYTIAETESVFPFIEENEEISIEKISLEAVVVAEMNIFVLFIGRSSKLPDFDNGNILQLCMLDMRRRNL